MLDGTNTFVMTKMRCSLLTSCPVEPLLSVGPLFMIPLRYFTTLLKIFLSILRSSRKNQISISVITFESADHDYARWFSRYPKADLRLAANC
jgi:hypothetical protein